uniref:Reverse transcriptase domain-containing protein n=2 Tax=Steinernema glaseri TaxID=37863 RepID=A0A1I7ZZY0_9BILA
MMVIGAVKVGISGSEEQPPQNCVANSMGATVSRYPSTPENYSFFSLSICTHDKIKIIDGTDDVVDIVQQNISRHYGEIQNQKVGKEGATCFKLADYPFLPGTFELSVKTKNMFVQLLSDLYEKGWKLWIASDLSRLNDYSTLFFRRCAPPQTYLLAFCVVFNALDTFQLIGAPEYLHDALVDAVHDRVQRKKTVDHCLQVKMEGIPWITTSFSQSIKIRSLMLRVFRTFRSHGFAYYGSMNMKGTADSIFFINDGTTLRHEDYCCISLNSTDRLRLIECPEELIDMASRLIEDSWVGGIQKLKTEGDCTEYKMKGAPWYASTKIDAVRTRTFLTALLQECCAKGWAVMTALDVSRKLSDKRGKHSLNIKLAGVPWECQPLSSMFCLVRVMMARIVTELEAIGWSVICSADVSAKFYTDTEDHSKDHTLVRIHEDIGRRPFVVRRTNLAAYSFRRHAVSISFHTWEWRQRTSTKEELLEDRSVRFARHRCNRIYPDFGDG